jgi:hypothetical protein
LTPILLRFCISINSGENLPFARSLPLLLTHQGQKTGQTFVQGLQVRWKARGPVIGFNSPERLRPNSDLCLKPKVEPAVVELFKTNDDSFLLKSKSRYICSRDNINSLLTEPIVPKSSNIANIKLL